MYIRTSWTWKSTIPNQLNSYYFYFKNWLRKILNYQGAVSLPWLFFFQWN